MGSTGLKRLTLILVLLSVVAGCASHSPDAALTACPEPIERELNDDPVEVTTSQGTTTIEPLVVGYKQPDGVPPECIRYSDRFEGFNRAVFAFNDNLYRWILIPVADGYKAVVPEPVQGSIGNFFSNLREPLNFVNHLLQLDGDASFSTLSRFVVNSTIGILGLFDPATHWLDIEEHRDTLADTLSDYGAGSGSYLVLPILGPSDVRGGFSTVIEGLASPVRLLTDEPSTTYLIVTQGVHDFSGQSGNYEDLSNKSDDPYVFFRELYIQSRMRDEAAQLKILPQEKSQPQEKETEENTETPAATSTEEKRDPGTRTDGQPRGEK